ncbi:MAG: hypothetical protein ACXAES_09760 [Promethearchaeota archaeon]
MPRTTSRGTGASHRRHGTGGGYASRVANSRSGLLTPPLSPACCRRGTVSKQEKSI